MTNDIVERLGKMPYGKASPEDRKECLETLLDEWTQDWKDGFGSRRVTPPGETESVVTITWVVNAADVMLLVAEILSLRTSLEEARKAFEIEQAMSSSSWRTAALQYVAERDEAVAKLEEAIRERDEARAVAGGDAWEVEGLQVERATITSLRAENERLREALKPFAERAEIYKATLPAT